MDALVFVAEGRVELLEQPHPEAGPGETVVEVQASGVCGSELHGFRSVGMRRPPLIMGHEFTGLTPAGERVVVNPLLACHECDRCRAGRPQQCERRGLIGVSRAGGFAEYVAVPTASLVPLPDSVGFLEGTLIEPLANAIHVAGIVAVGSPTDSTTGQDLERVAVIGGGTIGLLCAQVLRRRGHDVVVSELAPARRTLLERVGLAAAESLSGDFDVVVDAVGSAQTRSDSVNLVRPGGIAVWVGLAEPRSAFDGNAVVRGERCVVGSFAYTPDEFLAAVEEARYVDLDWCTPVAPADWADTFHALADGNTEIVKAVLVPEGATG